MKYFSEKKLAVMLAKARICGKPQRARVESRNRIKLYSARNAPRLRATCIVVIDIDGNISASPVIGQGALVSSLSSDQYAVNVKFATVISRRITKWLSASE